MSKLTTLPNIGETLAEKLEKAGIEDEKKLKVLGSEKAFLLIKEIDPKASLNNLYSIEGAIQGVKSALLSKEKKDELKEFFQLCQ
ncbi:MAG TPA: TfoX/Sxy family protein [Bacteroidales bacterium]|nr:TfoX/Sxy family protein [Bacteroidales bacterium]